MNKDIKQLELDEWYYAEKFGTMTWDEKLELTIRRHIIIPLKKIFKSIFEKNNTNV